MTARRSTTDVARQRLHRLLVIAAIAVLLAILLPATAANAAAPSWHLTFETLPTNLPPGGEGVVIVTASNLGDEPVDGSKVPARLTDRLPAGLIPTGIVGQGKTGNPVLCVLESLSCSFSGKLNPYEQISASITVQVDEPDGTITALTNEAEIEGGGASKTARSLPVPVNGEAASYGISGYELTPLDEGGAPATHAGSHPFQLTTTIALNQSAKPRVPVGLPKDFAFHLPPGLVGDTDAVDRCSMVDFFALVEETNLCPVSSVVGVATVTAEEPKYLPLFTKTVPLFNLVPAQGEPARFGFEVIGKVPVVIDTSLRSGSDYGVDAIVKNATETAGLLVSQVTLWGVPGDPRHNNARGWECVAGGVFHNQVGKPCPESNDGLDESPFLTLPTSCSLTPAAEPVVSSVDSDSWSAPGSFVNAAYEWMSDDGKSLGFTGCSELPFSPSIDVEPEEHVASTPSGVSIDVRVPQDGLLEPNGVATADVRDTTITLPPGVELSPSAANGLVGCSESQVGFEGFDGLSGMQRFNTAEAQCPEASKLGAVHIRTPLLPNQLDGALYLADPAPNGELALNPFNSLVAVYLVAKDPVSGVLVKLAGEGQIDEHTLRVATTFRHTPQVPFEELKVDLFGGPRASMSTPAKCGGYQADGVFAPWSGTGPVSVQSPPEPFEISAATGGGVCPGSTLAFAPGFSAFGTVPQAGSFTGFQLELTHRDGDQALSGLSMHLPAGVAAMLSSVDLCSEAQAAANACPASSEVGHATAIAGLGSEPIVQEGGRVFITGPYGGAPFGLEIVTPAKAGPFDLGFVTVRSKLFIDPHDASVMIASDPLPTQIRGIPLQLKRVLVTVDRPNFQFNGTSCDPSAITATVSGDEGATVPMSQRFQLGGCAGLAFAPKLTASVDGHASRVNGVTFRVKVQSGGLGQSNIKKVNLQLPVQLPSRLTTLQKACTEATFNANPANCSSESVIGTATISTPVLKNPLTGPAYLVSHGGAGFPDVEFVLQGEGVTVVLDGQTDIKNGVTYSKFESAPDAPFSTFETVLPAGPHSALSAYTPASPYDLCGIKLVMPTRIVSQSNKVIEGDTAVPTLGCGEVKGSSARKLTLAQRYAKALRACRARYKHNRHRRAACEAKVHKTYTAKATAACRNTHKGVKSKLKTCETEARRRYAARTARRGR